jgi:hypothetical protein
MPITEIVRTIASGPGLHGGRAVTVELAYDVDGRFGLDEDAVGYPAFWLRVDERVVGPFDYEQEAIDAARERFGCGFC